MSVTSFTIRSARASAVAAAVAAVSLAPAGAASAHVRVVPEDTTPGRFTALTFRVPTESKTASTTKVVVQLPTDSPLLFVSVRPVAGWHIAVTEKKLAKPVTVEGASITKAPATVTWTADAPSAGITPGQYQEFGISAGPLPAAGTLRFPATQTYSDGTVAQWNQPVSPTGDEPEHPVPHFSVAAQPAAAVTPAAAGPASDDDSTSSALPVAGVVLGAVGTLLGGAALVRSRSPKRSAR